MNISILNFAIPIVSLVIPLDPLQDTPEGYPFYGKNIALEAKMKDRSLAPQQILVEVKVVPLGYDSSCPCRDHKGRCPCRGESGFQRGYPLKYPF